MADDVVEPDPREKIRDEELGRFWGQLVHPIGEHGLRNIEKIFQETTNFSDLTGRKTLNRMKSRTIPDEDEESVRLELMEESPNFNLAIERIYRLTCNDVARFLKKKHSFLTADDLGTAASEAYIELDQKIRERKIDLNQPLPKLLFTIANRRAIDLVRKRNKKREPKLDFMETVFMDTFTAHDWAKKQRSGESAIILERIRVYISSAPRLMKAVGEALLHLAPPSPQPEDLKAAVDEILGKPTTLSSVASTLSRLRADLRNLVKN